MDHLINYLRAHFSPLFKTHLNRCHPKAETHAVLFPLVPTEHDYPLRFWGSWEETTFRFFVLPTDVPQCYSGKVTLSLRYDVLRLEPTLLPFIHSMMVKYSTPNAPPFDEKSFDLLDLEMHHPNMVLEPLKQFLKEMKQALHQALSFTSPHISKVPIYGGTHFKIAAHGRIYPMEGGGHSLIPMKRLLGNIAPYFNTELELKDPTHLHVKDHQFQNITLPLKLEKARVIIDYEDKEHRKIYGEVDRLRGKGEVWTVSTLYVSEAITFLEGDLNDTDRLSLLIALLKSKYYETLGDIFDQIP